MRKLSNQTLIYIVALLAVVVFFLLLGGSEWASGMMHSNRSMNMDNINWLQILIGAIIGFVLGILYSRRNWF
jgi:membrane protease YdiL (CAAX protease family)